MFKSSSSTGSYKILQPVLMLLLIAYLVWSYKGRGEQDPMLLLLLFMFVLFFPFYIWASSRLRYIEADENGVVIHTKEDRKLVTYNNILYATRHDPLSFNFVKLKYKDEASGLEKYVYYLPDRRSRRMMGDDELTEYIKNMLYESKPEMEETIKRIQLRNFLIRIGFGVLAVLLVILIYKGVIMIK